MLPQKFIVTNIDIAVIVPRGGGSPTHRNRQSHGLATSFYNPATYTFDTGDSFTINHGECIYLPKGSNYTCKIAPTKTQHPDACTYAINFQHIEEMHYAPIVYKPKATEKVFNLFKNAQRCWREKRSGFNEECMSSLYLIIKELKKVEKNYNSKEKTLSSLAPALEYINSNFTSDAIDIFSLAELCNISEVYLRRLFNQAFGMSPSVYIRNKRIAYAKELLLSGEYSVTDAAFMAGFNDTSYFSREFSREIGISPREYLKTQNSR